jgi:uncharacterized protein YegJ (DUF2314 family)
MMMRLIAIVSLWATILFVGCSKSKDSANYVHVKDNDAAMAAAIDRARATAQDFVTAFRAQKPGTANFFLKKPYPTPSGSSEHMWIKVTGESDGVFQGIVSNDAEETRQVKIGQKVLVKTNDISDWKYEDGKKLIGGYTIRYFVEKMSKAEREAFLKEAGFEL